VSDIPSGTGAIAAGVRARHFSVEAVIAAAQNLIATRDPVLNCFTSLYGEAALHIHVGCVAPAVAAFLRRHRRHVMGRNRRERSSFGAELQNSGDIGIARGDLE
jgi:hypothetical protein